MTVRCIQEGSKRRGKKLNVVIFQTLAHKIHCNLWVEMALWILVAHGVCQIQG